MYISSSAFGIKCYTCSSKTSMDDCDKNRKETDCESSFDRCGKASLEYKSSVLAIKSFNKVCATKATCDAAIKALKECKDAGGTCKADCCDKDLCNGGAAPMISVLLMVTGALVTFFR